VIDGMFCFKIIFDAPDQHWAKRYIAVFSPFAFPNMEHLALKVQIGNLQFAQLVIAQSTAIEQSDDQPVAKQCRGNKEVFYFLAVQDNGVFLWPFNAWQDHLT
jgi:hypothetical protein